NVGALKSGDYRLVARDVAAVVEASRAAGAIVKVIIEAALLTDDEKVKACVLAREACADFVKTSTGFGPGGATVADVALMRKVVGARNEPAFVEIARMLVGAPSVRGNASKRPSGEITGWKSCQLGTRAAEIFVRSREAPSGGLATRSS